MKTKLIIIFLFLSSLTIAQKKFEVTAVGGTNYTLIPDSLNPMNTKTGKFAYQSGFELLYRVFKDFRVGAGAYIARMSSKEIFKKIPGDEFYNYDIYVNHTLKFVEFPVFIRYDFFADKKLMPYLKAGVSGAKLNLLEDKLIKTDPAGNENDFWAQLYNFTFKNDLLYISDMRTIFAGIGANYKITDSFLFGANIIGKRFFYYEFDTKRSNYDFCGNITFSYRF